MEYIQQVFLGVQRYMQHEHEEEALIAFLDAEPAEFRSVAYESASFEIGLQDLSFGNELNKWKNFYNRAAEAHTFHMDIGLGWAFAKKEMLPGSFLESLSPARRRMVFDGLGYYHGLFNGRRTVKNQMVPDGVHAQALHGFDQGLGRRLWYISKGNPAQVIQLIQAFPLSRHTDLWRGLGIACGYVGGNDKTALEQLLNDATCKAQLCTGLRFAAISRVASNSITHDIELACEIICGKSLHDLISAEAGIEIN